jgi:hypothetical protein
VLRLASFIMSLVYVFSRTHELGPRPS